MQVGLRTSEQGCRAFSSVGPGHDQTNNGNKRGNTRLRSVTAAGPFRIRTGFPVRRPRQAAEPGHQHLVTCWNLIGSDWTVSRRKRHLQELGVGETTIGPRAEQCLEESDIGPEPSTHRLDSPADFCSPLHSARSSDVFFTNFRESVRTRPDSPAKDILSTGETCCKCLAEREKHSDGYRRSDS